MPDDPVGPPSKPPPGAGVAVDVGPPPEVVPPRPRRRWLRRIGTALLVLVAVAAIAGLFIHVPYRIISPGSATALDNSVVFVRERGQKRPANSDELATRERALSEAAG